MANNLAMNNPNNWDKIYKLFILICLIVLGLIISDMFKSCRKSEHVDINGTIKAEIKKDIHRKDSVKEVIVYRDSIRTKLVTKWRTRTDTLTKYEVIDLCDTLLVTDSLLISDLKHEISISDTIIRNYQKVVYNDSIVIIGLNKSIRKQKTKTKLALILAGIFGGVALVK
jgi:hypothetical protein